MLLGFNACGDDDSVASNTLTIAEESKTLVNEGIQFDGASAGSESITFEASQAWKATVEETTATRAVDWCKVTPPIGNAGKATITVSVDKNEAGYTRAARITVNSGTDSFSFTVTQESTTQGFDPSTLPTGISCDTESPNADAPLTIYYKADSKSGMYNYSGDVYVHIGTGSEDTWEYVPTTWGQNEAKYQMTKLASNVWKLELTPTIRAWFGKSDLAITKICLVIRGSAEKSDGSGSWNQTEDLFISVTDDTYEGFKPAAVVEKTMPSGLEYGINYVDNSTVTLVLYDKDTAGNRKDYAYVIGDFNDWTLGESGQMYRDEAAGCWWITLTGLDAAKEYAFQYYVGTGADAIRMADAYTEKILDPDNDKYISGMSYSYPDGARGILSTFQIQQEAYTWKVNDFKLENPDNLVIYELHLRDFTTSENLAGALDKLDYLKAMGVNAIELMPTQEFSGNDSWGYNPIFYFAMDKYYGTKNQYKEFIDACHERGLGVILDVVYNQADYEMPFVKMYYENGNPSKTNPWFNVEAPHPYSVFYDFNHESTLTRDFVKRNLKFLLEEYKLDGFRFDLTKGFTSKSSSESTASNYDASRVAILKDYNDAIKAVKADAYVILEHFCATSEEKELAEAGMHMWRNMNNAYCQTAMGYSSDSGFSGMYESTPAWVGFMESHDEERMGYKQVAYAENSGFDLHTNLTNRMKQLGVNAAFTLLVPGPKMIWQFGEVGYDISIEENGRTGRKPIHWDYLENEDRAGLQKVYTDLLTLRNANPELFDCTGTFTWKVAASNWNNGRTLYAESTTGKKLVVLGNFINKAVDVTVPADAGTWNNYFNGNAAEAVEATVSVPAHSFVVYTNF